MLRRPMADPIQSHRVIARGAVLMLLLPSILIACHRAGDLGSKSGSPLDDLPEWITPLLAPGVRPDWSADGTRIVYLDGLVGDVHELVLATGESRSLTSHFEHAGFTRAR